MKRFIVFAFLTACTRQSPPRPIGHACRNDAPDCGGAPAFCATEHANGYCETSCRWDHDCQPGATCVGGGISGVGGCHLACQSASDCRVAEGYACIPPKHEARRAYCDPPNRSAAARQLRDGAMLW